MKTRDLIKQLQEADPSGELDCCIGNHDILDVHVEPGYWDGSYHKMIRDENNPYYNIVGAEYRSDGHKVVLTPYSIKDAMLDNPDLPVTVVDNFVEKRFQKRVDEWRKEIKEIHEKVENWKKKRKKNE